MELVRYADRPDLREIRLRDAVGSTFPEFMHHNRSGDALLGAARTTSIPTSSSALVDDGELVAEVHSLPVRVGRSTTCRRAGTTAFERAFESGRRQRRSRCARDQVLPGAARRSGCAARMIEAMRDAGRGARASRP